MLVSSKLERRVSFRRAMKKCIANTIKAGAKGIKVQCSGRLGGQTCLVLNAIRRSCTTSYSAR